MMMVGPGTGVAPFRSFIWEYAARRSAGERTGRTWLFFGSHHRHSHFYYEEEWKELLANGNLTHLTLAFSRDQEEKIYVQHRLLEQGAEVARWILGGAHFYICGDAAFMAKDVERALCQILQQYAAIPDPQAYLRTMRQEKRYMKDVY
jgi:sulfite reductase (NADPH) flavoprotein alpha-component